MFYTGCRPGEVAALKWGCIKGDCSEITFSESYDRQTKILKGTKTNTDRSFPCNEKLQRFLLSIKPENCNFNDLVFTSKRNLQINSYAFYKVWKGDEKNRNLSVINKLIEQGKVSQYLKPYATRHTFITIQVNAGIDAHVIAKWVGNSPDIIWRHYYQHKQDQIPATV